MLSGAVCAVEWMKISNIQMSIVDGCSRSRPRSHESHKSSDGRVGEVGGESTAVGCWRVEVGS